MGANHDFAKISGQHCKLRKILSAPRDRLVQYSPRDENLVFLIRLLFSPIETVKSLEFPPIPIGIAQLFKQKAVLKSGYSLVEEFLRHDSE